MASTKHRAIQSSSPKKRSDQVPSASLSEFYAREDAEAFSLSWRFLEESFMERSKAIKTQIDALAAPQLSEIDLKNAEEALLHQVMILRRLNRFAMYRNRHERDVASEMLSNVDAKFLQLQNANNEIEHIRKEVERCYEFKSADEDIDLVPLEEFYKKAPATISREEVTRTDLHEQRIARLNWEMLERQNLVGTLQELEGRKNVLLSDISKKEYRLKSLKPKIEAIIEATRPVQELMSLKTATSVFDNQRTLFGYLPKELSVVAIQAEAYCDIAEDHEVAIECQGDVDSAIKFVENNCHESPEPDEDCERNGSPSGTVSPGVSAKRRRGGTVSEQIVKKRSLILVEHPVSLVLTIRCDGDITVSLHLRYVPELQAIAAKAKLIGTTLLFYGSLLCDESLLIDLFPNDDGEKCANVVGQIKLQQLKITVSDYESKIGRFFKFAQRMAGIDQGDSDAANLCDIIQNVVSEIRYRVRTRSALIRCIKNLSLLKVTEEMPPELRSQFPNRIVSRLSEFRMLTPTQFLSHEAVTEDYEKLVGAEALSCLENQFFFSTTIERSNATLTALIFIGTSYPKYSKPIYVLSVSVDNQTLTSKNCSCLKDLEAELNLMDGDYFKCSEEHMLYGQITFLMSRFDCFLEMYAERIKSTAFPKEHLYVRVSRGRDRQIPLMFDSSAGAFTFV